MTTLMVIITIIFVTSDYTVNFRSFFQMWNDYNAKRLLSEYNYKVSTLCTYCFIVVLSLYFLFVKELLGTVKICYLPPQIYVIYFIVCLKLHICKSYINIWLSDIKCIWFYKYFSIWKRIFYLSQNCETQIN